MASPGSDGKRENSLKRQQFVVSIIFTVVVPLAVLLIDLLIKHQIPDQDLSLTFAIFLIAAGASSRNIVTLALSIVLGAGYFIFYGLTAAAPEACPPPDVSHSLGGYFARYGAPVVFTLVFGVERYNRHVVEDEKFWNLRV